MEKTLDNARLALILFGLYNSSLEAISEYIYDDILLDGVSDCMPNAAYVAESAQAFERFALEKMQDFKLLGGLIFALGTSPVINASVRTPFYNLSGDLPSRTPVVLQRMISCALRYENAFARELSALINRTDGEASVLLSKMLENSQCRINRLQNMQN